MTKEYYDLKVNNNLGNANICTQVFEAISYGALQSLSDACVHLPSGFPKSGKHPITAVLCKDESLSLSIEVDVKYGVHISTITESIQFKVLDAIKQMTNIEKCKIDVIIKSIEFDC